MALNYLLELYISQKKKVEGIDIGEVNIQYFTVKDFMFPRFYLSPIMHKGLHDVRGTLVISNPICYLDSIYSPQHWQLTHLSRWLKISCNKIFPEKISY